jgi:hypothetical protein
VSNGKARLSVDPLADARLNYINPESMHIIPNCSGFLSKRDIPERSLEVRQCSCGTKLSGYHKGASCYSCESKQKIL